jgi:hypothetical protein
MAGCLGGFGSAVLWRDRSEGRLRRVRGGLAVALLVVSILAFGMLAQQAWSLRDATWWFWGPADLLFSLPFVVVVAGLVALIRRDRDPGVDESPVSDRAFRLWICHAPLALMWLFPAADIWHVVMVLPSFLPLLAWLLDRFWQRVVVGESEAWLARAWAVGLVGIVCGVLVVPPIHDVLLERGKEPAFGISLPRATGVGGGSVAMTGHGGDMVRYLVEPERRDVPILVLSAKPLFYFLTDRVSPLEAFDFTLYLAAIDAIPGHRARALADENEMIRQIDALHPLILDDGYDRASKNIRDAFPRMAIFIRSHYRIDATFGRFRVLRWRGADEGG